MSLLEHPDAVALLADAEVSAADVRGCRRGLERFLRRYLPRLYRIEQHELARVVLQGKLSNLERKTSEPIAYLAGFQRKPVQHFVGAGCWDDEAVLAELRRHVAEERGDPDGVLVLDPSGFPKTGDASCGVARQWCGRLGKVENCQVGVFLTYATAQGYAPLDRRLYLPREWGRGRRTPGGDARPRGGDVSKETWRIGLDLLDRCGPDVPFGWVAGDDEFGRASAFRAALRRRGLRYVPDVPCDTSIRDLGETPAPGRRLPPWRRVEAWAKAQLSSRWRRLEVGDGSKGPRAVRALETWVQTRDEKGRVGPVERLVVIRTVAEESPVWYTLSNACDVAMPGVVQAHGLRHGAGGGSTVPGGQGGGGAGPLRGAELGGLASSHDPVAVGVVVFGAGKGPAWGENPGVDRAADA